MTKINSKTKVLLEELEVLGVKVDFYDLTDMDIISVEYDQGYRICINNNKVFTENELFFILEHELERVKLWKYFEIDKVMNIVPDVNDYIDDILMERFQIAEFVKKLSALGLTKDQIIREADIPSKYVDKATNYETRKKKYAVLCSKVKELLKTNSMTVEELATRTGAEVKKINNMLNENLIIPYPLLYRFSKVFKCSVKSLFESDGNNGS